MEKKDLINYFDDILKKYSYKKMKNKWSNENEDLIKVIEIQKSKYGNTYYVNFGFIIKELELQHLSLHIGYGLGSKDPEKNKRIKELLDLENLISTDERKKELIQFIEKNMLSKLNEINNKNDIVTELEGRPHLNDVPLAIKKYFNLPI